MKINNIEVFNEHCLAEYPKEACGIVIENTIELCENISENPLDNFSISNSIYKEFDTRIQGIVHSHTMRTFKVDGRVPSKMDMLVAESLQTHSGILHCDGTKVNDLLWFTESFKTPLLKREYIPNIFDCYTLVRDYHTNARGISKLKTIPRNEDWNEKDPGILLQFKDEFSIKINFNDVKIGDVLIYKINSIYENHLAVVTGKDEMLHHFSTRLSSYDKISKWTRQLVEVRRIKE